MVATATAPAAAKATATAKEAAVAPSSTKLVSRRYLIARHGETDFNKIRRVQGTLDSPRLTPDGMSQAAALGAWVARRQMSEGDEMQNGIGPAASASEDAPPITRTWCSPMTRCRQTYEALVRSFASHGSGGQALPDPKIHSNLHEIDLREWQGRLRQEIIEQDSENWNLFKNEPKRLRLDNAGFAPVVDCWERAWGNWEAIRSDAAMATSTADLKEESSESIDGGDSTYPSRERDDEHAVVFIMCHGAMGQCMLLQALGMDIDMYGKSRRYSFGNCECVEIEWNDGEARSTRWRRVHPEGTAWLSTLASLRMDSGGLSSGR